MPERYESRCYNEITGEDAVFRLLIGGRSFDTGEMGQRPGLRASNKSSACGVGAHVNAASLTFFVSRRELPAPLPTDLEKGESHNGERAKNRRHARIFEPVDACAKNIVDHTELHRARRCGDNSREPRRYG